MWRKIGGIHQDIGARAYGPQKIDFGFHPLGRGSCTSQGVAAPGFAVAPDQLVGAAIKKQHLGRDLRKPGQPVDEFDKRSCRKIAVAHVDTQRDGPAVRRPVQQARHQSKRQIVNGFIAKILERMNRRRPPRAGGACHQNNTLPVTQSPPGTTHCWNAQTSSPPQQLSPQTVSGSQHSPLTQTPSHMSSQVGPVVGSVLDTVTSSVVESVLVPSVDSVAVVGPAVESVVISVAEPVVCPSVSLPDIVFPPVSVAVAGVELEPALVPGSVPSVSVSVPELVEVLGGEGGTTPVSARLICNPAGTSSYYSDTRDAEGKLVIGKQLKDYAD